MSAHKQFERGSTSSSHRTLSLTKSSVLSANGAKTSIATAATAQSYTGAALNGTLVNASHVAIPRPSGLSNVAQYPIAVASSSAGSYVDGSLITFVGTYGGVAVTRTATVVGTGGNATFIADGPVDALTTINVAAQANTNGAWTFGFNDVACPGPDADQARNSFRALVATSAGDVKVTCGSGDIDTPTFITGDVSNQEIRRVWFSAATTTITTIRLMA